MTINIEQKTLRNSAAKNILDNISTAIKYSIPLVIITAITGCLSIPKNSPTTAAVKSQLIPATSFDSEIDSHSNFLRQEGRKIFRYDTFGSEEFWGDKLKLHEAIAGEKHGGVGPGLTAKQALELGLKVDVGALPRILQEAIKGGSVNLNDPKTTLELLKADAVVGVQGFFDKSGKLDRIGIRCSLCHSTVDDSLTSGIGRRLDGWPNRDLNVGEIIAFSPNLRALAEFLGIEETELLRVLKSWGPGKYDAEFNIDGKGFRPDGKSAATLIPAAFGLAGQNLHTYEGWGSVPYWNAYVANTQMLGKGIFFDPRIRDASQFPIGERTGFYNKRDKTDQITSKLAALHYYQLSIPAPKPREDSYNHQAADRGKMLFEGRAQCGTCHVPPLFSEPGWPMHTAQEIGIDDFQANRSPDKRYRTTPLAGIFAHEKGGFYHDGRFSALQDVIEHYNAHLRLNLTEGEKTDLIEYLKSL